MVVANCYLCGEAAFKPTKDHVWPKALIHKSRRSAVYSKSGELRYAHEECNRMKGSLPLNVFHDLARKIFLKEVMRLNNG